MKIKIVEITRWEEDTWLAAGDASHNGDREVDRLIEAEKVEKMDNGNARGLPFVCDAENVEDAIQQYNDTYCEYDYLKAVECDWEEVAE